jgi:PhzF family phenazine biosynthesis protein
MRLRMFQVDAFADRLFGGNPAAVVPLQRWLPDALMQAIATENNLSETAFFVPVGPAGAGTYHLRWMTPVKEVELCGHATLASAWVLFRELEPALRHVRFDSRSGPLEVSSDGDLLWLDFPAWSVDPCPDLLQAVGDALGRRPLEVFGTRPGARDYLALYDTEREVAALAPDSARLERLDRPCVVATARGERADFVSRFFAPALGIPEDPVTGSAHCALAPFWGARLGKARMDARQISPRGGALRCELKGDRVRIGGRAVTYLDGTIDVGEVGGP